MSVLISDRSEQIEVVEAPVAPGELGAETWFTPEARAPQRPTVTPAPPRPADAPTAEEAGRARILAGLLRMADSYRSAGSLHQALEMYFSLMNEHEGTPQASEALDRILNIAGAYERVGELRQARSIYEQLL